MLTPPHKCANCRKLVVGPCPDCTKARQQRSDAARNNNPNRQLLRTERWKQTSRRFLAENPWCIGYPHGHHGTDRVLAQCTDHIKPVSKFPGLAFEWSNFSPLCFDCNRRKAAKSDDV